MTTDVTPAASAGRARLCDVVVAVEPPTPTHPDVASWRPATLGDVAAITATQKAMDAADHPDWTTPSEDVEDELTHPGVELAADSLVALDDAGDVLAWGVVQILPANAERVQGVLVGGVHPRVRGRGIGRVLLGWQLARGTARLALSEERLPAWLRVDTDERNPGGLALARRLGLRPVRWFTSMERIVTSGPGGRAPAIPVRLVPDGTRLVPYTADRAEDTRLARNDAFRDHWGSADFSPQRWAQLVGTDLFRADLSFLVVEDAGTDPSRVLGFALCNANEEDWELQGFTSAYLAIVGVTRDGRGRGLAPALLSAVLTAVRDAGLERVVLDVDTENPTGALGLYEGVGFVSASRSVTLALDVVA
ncbi:MAG: GNAT family N-acetyltransferase [Salana multivorans]|uniref:GNAT family N-acetyltransferase n=1 Tax=Salana multivorans TaxID=120377 RepID=UPI000A5CF334|nr:GNAT family N-acetyltransferase [Salana multivorans]MBN8883386.1 GNAT family N-acetyltransferase [Salana multivorans]